VISELDERGVKLYYVSIGTAERGREFVEKTGFPADRLLADPDSQTYEAMDWTNSFWRTLFSIQTPLSLLRRLRENGLKVLKEVLANWKPWIPPKGKQSFQLGGCLQFEGHEVVWRYKDPATGVHVNPKDILERVEQK